ncbi:MAG TPA: HAD family hydrolase [Spirochaetia bacterium]|nr:HAD family hydrolase [Spirochaetia bacterium]
MYRLLATDIDDTLLAPDGSLPERNRTSLRALHESGVAIVFCSGRADISIRKIAEAILTLADDEYIVSFNGARVVTAATRRIVTRHYVPPESVALIAEYAREYGIYLQGYLGDEFLVEHETDRTLPYSRATDTTFRVVENLTEAMPEGSPKLLMIGDHDSLAAHREHLVGLVGDVRMVFSKTNYLEIVDGGVDKGSALTRLAGELGIPIEETVAVGDAANDVEMLRAAGLGIAVGNARAEAREAAEVVLDSHSADGVMEEVARRFFS